MRVFVRRLCRSAVVALVVAACSTPIPTAAPPSATAPTPAAPAVLAFSFANLRFDRPAIWNVVGEGAELGAYCVILADYVLPSLPSDLAPLCGGGTFTPPPGHAFVVFATGGMASAEPTFVAPTSDAAPSMSCGQPARASHAVLGTVYVFGCFSPPGADAAIAQFAAMVESARTNGNAAAVGPRIPLPSGVSATLLDPSRSPITAADAVAAVPAELSGPQPAIRLERITAWPYVPSEARRGTVLWVVYSRTTASETWSFVSNNAQLIRTVRQP